MRIQNLDKTHRTRGTTPLCSHQIRNGLVQSLQPLQKRFPSLLTLQQHQQHRIQLQTMPIPYFLQQSYSLGLQPYVPNHLNYAPMQIGDFHARSLLFAASMAPPISFFNFLIVFIAGGLFFSTAIAAATACYAMGMDNIKRILGILGVVLERVWITFSLGMGATRLALLGEEHDNNVYPKNKRSWKWKSAWQTLKEKLGETKRTAAEGVKALRQEANLYAAAVGPPGLIPMQYIIDRLMPLSLATMLENSIRDSLSSMPRQKTIKKMTLSSFKGGKQAPVLEAARFYDVDNAIAFDYDVKWDSDLEATVQLYTIGGIARVPVSLKDFSFEGVVRVILAPLSKSSPGYGATLLSLPAPPKINVNVKVLGGEVTRLPFLRSEITSAMQKAISDELLWPRRIVIPTMAENDKTLLSSKELEDLETTDPLLEAEKALKASTTEIFRDVGDVVRGKSTEDPGPDMFRVSVEGKNDDLVSDKAKVIDVVPSETTTGESEEGSENLSDMQKGVLWSRLKEFFQNR